MHVCQPSQREIASSGASLLPSTTEANPTRGHTSSKLSRTAGGAEVTACFQARLIATRSHYVAHWRLIRRDTSTSKIRKTSRHNWWDYQTCSCQSAGAFHVNATSGDNDHFPWADKSATAIKGFHSPLELLAWRTGARYILTLIQMQLC